MKKFEKIFFWIVAIILVVMAGRWVWVYVSAYGRMKRSSAVNEAINAESARSGVPASTIRSRYAVMEANIKFA